MFQTGCVRSCARVLQGLTSAHEAPGRLLRGGAVRHVMAQSGHARAPRGH